MNRFSTVTKPLMWFTALLLAAVVAGCGGGNGTTLVSIAVTPTNPSIALGTTQQFTATGTYSDTTTQDLTTSVTWGSSSTGVATVSNTAGSNGLATPVATGNTTITATLAAIGSTAITAMPGSISGAATLTVTSATLVSIAVTPATPSIPVTTTQQFTATATYSDGLSHDVTAAPGIVWSSGDTSIATVVSTTGLATGVTSGTVVITATFGGQTATENLTVNAATLVSIAVTPATPSIPVTTTQQFTAIATYNVGPTVDVTANLSTNWSAVDVAPGVGVASVGLQGLATGNATGQSTITASFGGQASPPATLTVNAATLVSIAVTPATPSIPVTTTQQFTAMATYNVGPTIDVTASAIWASGTPGVATFGVSGLATGVAFGTSDITAAFGGQTSPIAILTVTDTGPAGPSPDIGTAGTYGIIAGAAVTLNGTASIIGDLALDPSGSLTGTGTVSGTTNNGGGLAHQARLDQNAAFTDASTRTSLSTCAVSGNLVAMPPSPCGNNTGTFSPGLYNSATTLNIADGGTIILDAQNNPDAVFIFQMGTALTTGVSSTVSLVNQAQAKNVWWVAPAGATLGVTSVFVGTVMADTGPVTVNNGSTVTGRLFSNTAAVTVDTGSTITVPAP